MLKRSVWPAALLAATLSFAPAAGAAEPFTTAKVVFRNPGPYSQADLEAAAGVHAGDRITLAGIKAAAQRLVETQVFSMVTMDSSGPGSAMTLIFMLKPLPAAEMLPVEFENFVWLTPEERDAILHKSAPLFQGSIPAGSKETDAIAAALEAALVAKGVASASVTHEEVQPTTAQPVHAIEFRVTKPAVVVDRVELEDSGPMAAQVRAIAAKVHRDPYAEGYASDAAERLLLRPYLDTGFLDAHLVDAKVEVEPGTADRVPVNLHARVDAGELYHVGEVHFTPTALVSADAFAGADKLKAGDAASRGKLLESVAAIDAAYAKQGYADEYVDTRAVLDRASHIANYNLTVVPGDQYRIHAVTVENLPPPARAQFDLAWRLKPGDLYDAEYVRDFWATTRPCGDWPGTPEASRRPAIREPTRWICGSRFSRRTGHTRRFSKQDQSAGECYGLKRRCYSEGWGTSLHKTLHGSNTLRDQLYIQPWPECNSAPKSRTAAPLSSS